MPGSIARRCRHAETLITNIFWANISFLRKFLITKNILVLIPVLTHPPNQRVNTLVFQRGKHTIAVSFMDRRVGEVSIREWYNMYVPREVEISLYG